MAKPTFSIPVGPRLVTALSVVLNAGTSFPVLIEGPTGIGKSETVKQIANALGIGYQILDLKVLDPTDLVGIPYVIDGRTYYATPVALPTEGAGILVLEELNRAPLELQQAIFQLLTERRIHGYRLPDGWVVWALVNPANGDYQVSDLDPALRDRFLRFVAHSDRASWLEWAQQSGVHPAVLRVASEHDHVFDTITPRTWKRVSDLLWTLSQDQIHAHSLLCDLFGNDLGEAWFTILLTALERTGGPDGINATALLANYDREPEVQTLVASFKANGKTDKLEQIVTRIESALAGSELPGLVAGGHIRMAAFESLIADLPGDMRERLQKGIADQRGAIPLVAVKPEEFLTGDAATSKRIRERIAAWLANPLKRHRVDLLLTALTDYIKKKSDLKSLRKDTHARKMLGWLIGQAGGQASRGLVAALREREVRPMAAEGFNAA
jgi:hypothetical protein